MNQDYFKKIHPDNTSVFHRSVFPTYKADKVFDYYLKNKKINTILEIGTYNGVSASILSKYAKNIITIDIIKMPITYNISNIKYHVIKNEIEKEKLINSLDFDFAFMDGDHCHYTYSDWMLVRKCNRVLFHEYWPEQKPVFDLVNSLPENEIDTYFFDHSIAPWAYWEKK